MQWDKNRTNNKNTDDAHTGKLKSNLKRRN